MTQINPDETLARVSDDGITTMVVRYGSEYYLFAACGESRLMLPIKSVVGFLKRVTGLLEAFSYLIK